MPEPHDNYEFNVLYLPGVMSSDELREYQRQNGGVVVAADGMVPEAPSCSLGFEYVLNHHEGVDRNSTPATCKQGEYLLADKRYQRLAREMGVTLLIDGYDPDVAETIRRFRFDAENTLADASPLEIARNRRLTNWEDRADRSCGRFLLGLNAETAGQIAHVYYPSMELRRDGFDGIEDINIAQKEIEARSLDFIAGSPGTVQMDKEFEVIEKRKHTLVIKEVGAFAVVGAMTTGYRNIVSQRIDKRTGQRQIALHSMDGLITPAVLSLLNRYEMNEERRGTPNDSWGGCEFTAGSPRVKGTAMPARTAGIVLEAAALQRANYANAA